MRRKILLILSAVVLLGAVFLWKNPFEQTKTPVTATIRRGTIRETLSLSGKIAAEETAILRFQTSGRLAWIGVKVGDQVKKYQGVASLDTRDVRATLNKYLAAYAKSRWDFETTKDQSGDAAAMTTAARRSLEKAQFDLNSAVLDVELKNLTVEYSSIWSPIDGVVVRAESPLPGVNVTPTQAEFEIVNPASLYFSTLADQTDITKLSASLSGMIVLDAFPEEKISGRVYFLAFAPKTGETGTVYEAKIALPPEAPAKLRLRPGMTGDAEFVLREKSNVLALPTKFIKADAGKKLVYLKKDGGKIKTFITVGEELDDKIEILDGLKEGDVIFEN